MKIGVNQPCPCGSGTKFKRCCRPCHQGLAAPTPQALMRSRYAAYALGEVDYLLATTHPAGPHFEADEAAWRASVRAFCAGTRFVALNVLASEPGATPAEGFVTFRATLTQGGQDASFSERSRFLRQGGRWLYHSGERVD